MIKRIALFVVTNIFIMLAISIIIHALGLNNYLTSTGINYQALLIFCLIWGMVGSIISLMLSRFMAKQMMGVQVIDPQHAGSMAWLVNMVYDIAKRANLPAMPEVGVYNSPDVNAFATGPSKSRSLVAVSSGLLESMDRNEIEGVIGHEIAHIANGDMVTMTLIQGVVNAFVMFLARVFAYFISQGVKEDMRHLVHFLSVIILQILFGWLGLIVVCWFSRQREFRADKGSAAMVGKDKMIAALRDLGRYARPMVDEPESAKSLAALKISSSSSRWNLLFSTHPPLEQRIESLQKGIR